MLINKKLIKYKKGGDKMAKFPEENDLLSLFECEPTLLDSTTKDLPF